VGPNVGKVVDGKYAGTVEERVSDILWAFADTTIKAVICNRGGYGTIHLIGQLPIEQLKSSPKWLVGFSDISTLHGLLNRAGMMNMHGTMSSFLATSGGTDATSTLMRDLLMGSVPRYELPAHPQNIEGTASGVLVGGNLCSYAAISGTKFQLDPEQDVILFIEEVDEYIYHIDRMMHALKRAGKLEHLKGLIVGGLTQIHDNPNPFGMTAEQVIAEAVAEQDYPVCFGFPAGHFDDNRPLFFGQEAKIEVTEKASVFLGNLVH
jgi:muramoyltetrapeptide carboxypeptidase